VAVNKVDKLEVRLAYTRITLEAEGPIPSVSEQIFYDIKNARVE
jgi:hypothetical protein